MSQEEIKEFQELKKFKADIEAKQEAIKAKQAASIEARKAEQKLRADRRIVATNLYNELFGVNGLKLANQAEVEKLKKVWSEANVAKVEANHAKTNHANIQA
jgi:hypothetical protein